MEICKICGREYQEFVVQAYTSSGCGYPHTPDNICPNCVGVALKILDDQVNTTAQGE
jgi:hypothetical protein